jgi:hypothetical protein
MWQRRVKLLLSGLLLSATATLAVADDPIPHVGERAREHFQSYRYAEDHRAFAIAPGGAWPPKRGPLRKGPVAASACRTCDSRVLTVRRWRLAT